MLVRLMLILLLGTAVLLAVSCGDNPSDPQRNNSLDTENPETSGDPFQLQGTVGASGVTLAWQAVDSPTPHEYRIKRRAGDTGAFSTIGTQEPPVTDYQDNTVQAGTTYHYKIAAADEDGVESSISAQVAVTVHSLAVFSINNGDASTPSREVTLNVRAQDCDSLWVWNGALADSGSGQWLTKTNAVGALEWPLDEGPGTKSVHATLNYRSGQDRTVSDTITLDETPPDLSGLIATPADGAIDVTDRELSWSGVTDATSGVASYRVLLDDSSPPTTEIYSGAETSCSTGALQSETTYRWQLIAIDALGNEAASEELSFATIPNPPGFVTIPSGEFAMGSPDTEDGHQSDEEPQHTVTLTRWFWMQETEVTNVQYAELAQWALDHDPPLVTATSNSLRDALGAQSEELLDLNDPDCEISYSDSEGVFTVDTGQEDHPVKEVTWYGAAAYCDWLSLREGLPRAYDHDTWQCNGHDPYGAEGYRLPTEAEWEYACRAGTTTPFNTGSCLDAGTEANYDGDHPYSGCPDGTDEGETVPVGSYPRNDWDLYDMHGNVHEWCNDWYASYGGDATDPPGPSGPDGDRVIRGGDWRYGARYCRSANRDGSTPGSSGGGLIGFRPVRSTP